MVQLVLICEWSEWKLEHSGRLDQFQLSQRRIVVNDPAPQFAEGPEPLTYLNLRIRHEGNGSHLIFDWDGPEHTGRYRVTADASYDDGKKEQVYSLFTYESEQYLLNYYRLTRVNAKVEWLPPPGSKWPAKTIHRSYVVEATPTPAPAATNTPAPNFPDALTSITTSNITNTSVDIDWDGPTLNRDQYNYVVEVRAGSEGRGLNTVHSQATLSDLTPGTTYTGVVRIDAPRSNHWG